MKQFLGAVLLVLCSLSPVTASDDLSKLVLSSFEDEEKSSKTLGCGTPPFLAVFKKDDCELHYLAADHSYQKDSPTFQMIEKEVDTFKPTFMILEGFQTEWIEGLNYSEENKDGEPLFALSLGKKNGIKVIAGEPKDSDHLRQMHEKFGSKGAKSEDVLVFYVLRQMKQRVRCKQLIKSQDVKKAVDEVATIFQSFLDDVFGYDKAIKWMSIQGIKDPESVFEKYLFDHDSADFSEVDKEVEKRLQEICSYDMYVRDKTILTHILDAYKNAYKKIFIVYGGSHFFAQYAVLKSAFGNPTFIRSEKKCVIL
jgi:hypothetical protein